MLSGEKGRLILVAEEEPEIWLIRCGLRRDGYSVIAVADGEEALKCFAVALPVSPCAGRHAPQVRWPAGVTGDPR